MIKLYGFGPAFGLPDPSPFVLLVDAWLSIHGIPFERVPGFANLRVAPLGKLPFIEDDGELIADSAFILDHLRAKHGPGIDAGMSDGEQAQANLAADALRQNLYWCMVRSRWFEEQSWQGLRRAFFGGMPWPLRKLVPVLARRRMRGVLHNQGIGRYSAEQAAAIGNRVLASLSTWLGSRDYFFGGEPRTFDVTAYAFLAEQIQIDLDFSLARTARGYDNLVAFCDRMQASCYGPRQAAT